jgi:hypothetical protein
MVKRHESPRKPVPIKTGMPSKTPWTSSVLSDQSEQVFLLSDQSEVESHDETVEEPESCPVSVLQSSRRNDTASFLLSPCSRPSRKRNRKFRKNGWIMFAQDPLFGLYTPTLSTNKKSIGCHIMSLGRNTIMHFTFCLRILTHRHQITPSSVGKHETM